MKRPVLLILLLFTLVAHIACNKEDTQEKEPHDKLEQQGILGQWKLESQTRNGITNMAVPCCDTLIYTASGKQDDLKGTFKAVSSGYATVGEFELLPSTNNIRFIYDDTQKIYQYQLAPESINFSYKEDQDDMEESWKKLDQD